MVEVNEELTVVLKELRKTGDIEASAVVRRDGLMVASDLSESMEDSTVAAMTAALVGTAETFSSELSRGQFKEVVVDSEKGKLVAIGAGKLAILICVIKEKGNLGFVLISIERAAKTIEELLKGNQG